MPVWKNYKGRKKREWKQYGTQAISWIHLSFSYCHVLIVTTLQHIKCVKSCIVWQVCLDVAPAWLHSSQVTCFNCALHNWSSCLEMCEILFHLTCDPYSVSVKQRHFSQSFLHPAPPEVVRCFNEWFLSKDAFIGFICWFYIFAFV